MKINVEIDEALLSEAREFAKRQGVTLHDLVERGLRRVITESRQTPSFKLRRASFKGNGLQPALREAPWEDLRGLSYGACGMKWQPS
jgi:hypothetical protein